MKKEALLKIFYKYGFHSLNKEPFLYEGNLGIGICYTFKDPIYGFLTRIYIPENESQAEDFFAKYFWYKKNNERFNVNIHLSNYKVENPEIEFVQDEKKLTFKEMKALETTPNEDKQKENKYLKKLQRTALLLVEIIEDKIKLQNTTYLNLIKLNEQYQTLFQKLEQKKQEYNHSKVNNSNSPIAYEETKDYSSDLVEMKENIKRSTKEDLTEYINILIKFLEDLESDESFIQNKYELIKLPLEIEVLQKQMILMEEVLKKKRGMFSKKENINPLLEKIAKESSIHEIVSFKQYKTNELKRVKEKYSMIPDLDIRTIGDFFIEFDNLTIKEPVIEQKKNNKKIYTYEEAMEYLENNFEKRPSDEKQILILYHSILRKIRLYTEANQSSILKKYVQEFIELIDNPNNIIYKIKYFKNINTSSVELCLDTIEKELNKINNIALDQLLTDINVFFKDGKMISNRRFIEASNKRLLAPSQKLQDNEVMYLATLNENANVYFIPHEIVCDLASEDTLIQKTNHPFFLIDMEKNSVISKNSDIIKVANYKEIKKKTDLGIIVTKLENTKVEQYQEIIIGGISHE